MEYYSISSAYGNRDELFKALITLDKERVEALKAKGVALTDDVKNTLLHGGGSFISGSPASGFWYGYLTDLENVAKLDFVYISRELFAQTCEPLYFSDSLNQVIAKYFFNPEVFTCLLECYDQKKLNKTRIMKELIRKNNVPLLEKCAEHGWLKQTKKRDEMIDYAAEQNRPECTAWLLEFKSRTADLAAERKKAEKKQLAELNAAPDSAAELKKLWTWEKGEDGGLIIKSYKGDKTEVEIPAKIGKNSVTAIGDYALSPEAPRLPNDSVKHRAAIQKIVVPDSVKKIGESAFGGVGYYHWTNTPSQLKELVIPDTLDIFNDIEAAKSAPRFLAKCGIDVLVVPDTPAARYYCIKNNVQFRFEKCGELHTPFKEIIKSDELFAAILAVDKEKVEKLKGSGFPDYIKECLQNELYGIMYYVQREIADIIAKASADDRRYILENLVRELGEPLYCTNLIYSLDKSPELWDCLLKFFDTKRINKTDEMKRFINKDQVEYLAVFAENGCLKNSATRDKLIQYATENNKTECTAWLLDYKNRTSDPEKERKRAEKKLERELNAPPPTEEELREKSDKLFKRMFTYEIADGEVVITGYKGSAAEVEIPREFEGKPVVAIGEQAFYPSGSGVPTRHRHNRANVKRVVFPDTVRTIGDMAFCGCRALREVVIPSSVTKIGSDAFFTMVAITFIVERGSLAEKYCKVNGEKIAYKVSL